LIEPATTPDPRRWWVLVAVGIGTFMSALDGSIINTVLPLLRAELDTTVAGIEWVATIYLLVVSGLLLGFGRAGDIYGQKRVYLLGFVVFMIGSALSGRAPSAPALVALRVVQAIGAAMLFSSSPAILTKSFPGSERGRALGIQGTMTYLGLTVGPSLGGWIAHTIGWRWVFYINVPVGIIAAALAWRMVPDDRPSGPHERFDIPGAVLFIAGLSALMVALNQGHDWGWTAAPTLGLTALALVLLAAFIRVERRTPSPMLDLSLFRNRIFAASATSAFLNYLCVYSVTFVIPFLLIQGRGLDTQHAGVILTAQPLVMAIVAPISGTLSDRLGTRGPAILGMAILALGLLFLAWTTAHAPLTTIAAALAVVGLGVGIFVSPNNSALMGAAPRERQGIAAGVLATARNAGMVCGIGLAGAIFTTSLAAGTADSLVHGVQASLLTAAGIAVMGAVTSWLR